MKKKMAFITVMANYCYKVMPFGLKNMRAIYQRLMNKVFAELIGDLMEVYINDMLIKTKKEESLLRDLKVVFSRLRSKPRQMPSNPWNEESDDGERSTMPHGENCLPLKVHGSVCPESHSHLFPFEEGEYLWMDTGVQSDILRLQAISLLPSYISKPEDEKPLFLYLSVSDATIAGTLVWRSPDNSTPYTSSTKCYKAPSLDIDRSRKSPWL